MSHWAVVQTMSGREDAVAERIERIGYAVLAPRAKFEINGKMRISAIFPGYIFAEVRSSWYDIKNQPGVTRIIMAGEQPARVPNAEIETIMKRIGRNGLVKLADAPKANPLSSGSAVKILTGSFQGLNAVYRGMSARERQIVLLELLGRKVSVELHKDDRIVPTRSCA